MQLIDQDLSRLIERGTKNGFLTFDEVNAFLPDEGENPAKLNNLIVAIECHKIQLIDANEPRAIKSRNSKRPEPNVAEMRSAGSAKSSDCLLYTSPSPRD